MWWRSDRRPPAPGRFVEVNGIRWHFEQAGSEGPELLLFHGYLGSTANWRPALPILSRALRVTTVDFPGAGYSDRPRHLPFTPLWFAQQIPALVDALGLEQPFIGGHSLGGSVAVHAVVSHPDLARGLILVAPLVYRQRPPPGLRFAEKHPRIALAFFSSLLGKAWIPRLVRRSAFAGKVGRSSVRVRRLIDHLDAPGGWEAATKTGLSTLPQSPRQEELSRVRVPTLLAWGRHDRVHKVRCARRVAGDLGVPSEMLILERSAHHPHEEEAHIFAPRVVEFCTAQERPSARRDLVLDPGP